LYGVYAHGIGEELKPLREKRAAAAGMWEAEQIGFCIIAYSFVIYPY
jgi:hypothetical protein